MTLDYLAEAMNEISNEHIEEAAYALRKSHKLQRQHYGVLAACLLLLCVTILPQLLSGNDRIQVVSGYKTTAGNSNSYVAPEPGQWFCFVDVDEARKVYAGNDVEFLLAFDLFPEDGKALSEEEKNAEYQRLAGLGYQLFEVEYWDYYGDGQKATHSIIVGLFTEEQLTHFNVNPHYGYAFHFVYNGDHSSLKFDKSNAITFHPS